MRVDVRAIALGLGLFTSSLTAVAFAQTAAPAEVTQHGERVAARDGDDDVRLLLSAGSALTYGNARNLAINLSADFLARMGQHAFVAQIGWIYGIASQRDGTTFEFGNWQDSANNLTWRVRYDFFLTDDDALFVAHYGRRDPFASLDPRIGAQAGYMRNFVREENHRFWGEIGYDFAYDQFAPDPMTGSRELQIGTDQAGMPILSSDRALNSLRLFIGYDNHINEVLTYQTGLEALMRFDRPEHWRFQWVNQLRSKLADWLQISLDLTGRLDSLPPGQLQAWNEQPGQRTQMLDVIVTLNLVGTFDMYTAPAPEEEEEEAPCPAAQPCDCPEGGAAPADAATTDAATEGTEAGGTDSTATDSTATDSTATDTTESATDAAE